MTVSTNEYVLYTLYELTVINIYYSFQVTGTVQLVTDSTFEVERVTIQGSPRQIPDGDPNRFSSLEVPGPSIPGGEVKQPSLCILFTLDT